MKKLLFILPLLAALTVSAQIQTNAPPLPTSPSSFYGVVFGWATSLNPSNNWTDMKGELAAGIDSISNYKSPLVNSLRFGYDVWKIVDLEAMVRDAGVQGTFTSAQGGLGVSIKTADLKITLSVTGGENFNETEGKYFGEVNLRASKHMTRYTHAFVGLGQQFPFSRRTFTAGLGFTF